MENTMENVLKLVVKNEAAIDDLGAVVKDITSTSVSNFDAISEGMNGVADALSTITSNMVRINKRTGRLTLAVSALAVAGYLGYKKLDSQITSLRNAFLTDDKEALNNTKEIKDEFEECFEDN